MSKNDQVSISIDALDKHDEIYVPRPHTAEVSFRHASLAQVVFCHWD